MLSARFVTVFAFAAGVGFIVANCGGDDGGGSSYLTCPNNTGGGTCTAEQNKAYSDCVVGKCDTQYQACFGSGYKGGSFGGPCAAYASCYAKCNCDRACQMNCGIPTGDCQTCLVNMVGGCVLSSGCTAPVCTGGGGAGGSGGTGGSGGGTGGAGGSGGGGTCFDLMKCCAAMTNADQKAQCNQAYMSIMQGGDAACGGVLMIYRANKLCP